MTRSDLRKVRSIAKHVRTWSERVAERRGFEPDLNGLCAVAAGKLHKLLREAGFKSVIALNDGHGFVLLNGYVVDVTATQFEGFEKRPVVVERLTHIRRREMGDTWRIHNTFISRSKARDHQLDQGWSADSVVASPRIAGA